MQALIGILVFALAVAAAVLLLIFVLVPLFKGIGWLIAGAFRGVGWLIAHVFEFVAGMIGDALRFIGAVVASVILAPLAVLNLVIGRWSSAGHYAESVKRECRVGGACLYRVLVRRPLKLLMLHGLLEGVEQRVPEAVAAAPAADRPGRSLGRFPGYEIVGSLRGGGSGARLYIAIPDDAVRRRYPTMPGRVVIKAFALSEGSTLPQILRESRALECAKQLGRVFDHGMDEHRFFYVMPYIDGDHLGIVTRQLHGEAGSDGLGPAQLDTALRHACDLVETLCQYHRGGLWHKDVKPENVIVHDGQAHLVDLGLVTPLRSAMTLTTHGTEYFRDPEMVRQALRGVKVHQVNGAKFDIYAAGAVLYFMIENTFPPHGALSRFTRRSPDAVRWIVRRSMADYNHRYESAEEMLSDLRAVAAAADPFAVKPAGLPSMAGAHGRPLDEGLELGVAARGAAFAAPPPPPPPPSRAPSAASAAAPAVAPGPAIEVTNWWTGAYRVTDPQLAGAVAANRAAHGAREESLAREARTELRAHDAELRRRVREGAISARHAARARMRAARRQARTIHKQMRSTRAVAERQPSPALTAIGVATVLLIGAAAIFAARRGGDQPNVDGVAASVAGRVDRGRPVLLVPDARWSGPWTEDRLHRVISTWQRNGYDVVLSADVTSTEVPSLIEEWRRTHSDAADRALEDALERNDFFGFVHVVPGQDGEPYGSLIWAERDGAGERRFIAGPPATPRPILLVNDHPTKHDPAVARIVNRAVDQYRLRGWDVIENGELEAKALVLLPTGPVPAGAAPSPRLSGLLSESGLGGLLYVHAEPGDGPPADRVSMDVLAVE
jgi:serine/threonine protein kinase